MIPKKILRSPVLFMAALFAVTLLSGCSKKSSPEPEVEAVAETVPGDFDWKSYLHNNPELETKGIDTEEEAKQHWLEFGKKEGRRYQKEVLPIPSDFDWDTYVSNYADLKEIKTKEAAAEHWLAVGQKEGRTYKVIPAATPEVSYMPWQTTSPDAESDR